MLVMSNVRPIVYSFRRLIDFSRLRALSRQDIIKGWSGEPLVRPFSFVVAVDPDRLYFLCEMPGEVLGARRHAHLEFVEGLVSHDVAELYVMGTRGEYQEFHLSRDGAWWSMCFDSCRVRKQSSHRPSGVEIEVCQRDGFWEGVMSVPRAEISVELDEVAKFNIAGYLYNQGNLIFLSSIGQPDYAPDFHTAASFQSAEWVHCSVG